MNAKTMICASALALASALAVAQPAQAALTLIAVGGGGGGSAGGSLGGGGVISESGTSGGSTGGAGGTGGLGGAGSDGGGGAGWLGAGSNGIGGAGGLSAPTFAGGAGFANLGHGGFGGGGGSGFQGGGGGGGYSGGGGGDALNLNGGGGGGSYLNPAVRDTIETPDFNGVAGHSPLNGYVIVGLTVFNYTGTVVEYTIPTTGFYYVAAVGAQGGPQQNNAGGYGAGVGGSVLLDAGTELDIVVGGAGIGNPEANDGGGGGGSFVWDPTAIPVQPVPEPSTWAMMLMGFAGLGYAGWRARRQTVRV